MNLKDTIKIMNSDDYKERFKAEYLQTKIRYEKLHKMIVKYTARTLDFTPTCPIELLKHQKSIMEQYLYDLEVRAEIECIDLEVE
jgi:alkyl hydroperoxide reductase subunit AhpC